jgi:hypothetical protein
MATVTKDFKIKSGLIVEGTNATVDGSDIITEDIITGGTQTNISVTYDAQNKVLNFEAENGVADSTTDDLTEGENNLYFTNARVGSMLNAATTSGIDIEYNPNNSTLSFSVDTLTIDTAGPLFYNGSNQLDINVGFENGLEVDGNGALVADYSVIANNLAGFGLDNSGDTLVVNANDLAGTYLNVDNANALTVDKAELANALAGTYLDYDSMSQNLKVDAEDLANTITGNGLTFSSFGGRPQISLDVSTLAGTYLNATGASSIAVDKNELANALAGSGLTFDTFSNNLAVNVSDIVGTGIAAGGMMGNDLVVDANAIAGAGLTASNATTLAVNYANVAMSIAGAGLELDGSDNLSVTVDNSTLTINGSDQVAVNLDINNGLEAGMNGVAVKLNPTGGLSADGDGIEIRVGNGLAIDTASTFDLIVDTDVIATRSYVDSAVSGLSWKPAVNLLITSNVNLSDAGGTYDGHALGSSEDGYRVLLTGQTTDSENGIYVVSLDPMFGKVILTRAEDADAFGELVGAAVFVMEGTTYGSTSWVQSNHYLTDFGGQEWDQFSGQGSFTAGNGITLTGNEFAINDNVVVTHTDLDGYLNSTDGTTYVALTSYVDTAIETGDATATPTYLAVDINSIATQVAATATTTGGSAEVVYEFNDSFRAAKFLVKLARGTHTEVSEVLLTLDTSDNIAITEYAVVGTNGSLGTISATYNGIDEKVQLTVDTPSATTVKVAGTLLA